VLTDDNLLMGFTTLGVTQQESLSNCIKYIYFGIAHKEKLYWTAKALRIRPCKSGPPDKLIAYPPYIEKRIISGHPGWEPLH